MGSVHNWNGDVCTVHWLPLTDSTLRNHDNTYTTYDLAIMQFSSTKSTTALVETEQ